MEMKMAPISRSDLLDLIQPINETIFGTPHDDTLAAAAEGDVVLGLGGDDQLRSDFNRTALFGGADNDTLTTDVTISRTVPRVDVHGIAVQDGGAGDDILNINMNLEGLNVTSETFVRAGTGNDQINITANFTVVAVQGANVVTNTADGGAGDDHITVSGQTGLAADSGEVINCLRGGSGNDFLDATANAQSLSGGQTSNSLDGGAGDDVLLATCVTATNTKAPIGINELFGGDGNDVLQAIQVTGTNGISNVTNDLHGGNGNDSLLADTNARAVLSIIATNVLDGGNGNDNLVAHMTAELIGGGGGVDSTFDVSNVLTGGNGNDHLEADITVTPVPFSVEQVPVENHLDGGSGNDVLIATIAEGTKGSSFLDAGTGNDQLTVFGGSGNVLNGGSGQDQLTPGVGDDLLIGGGGLDTFRFDVSINQGVDTIEDFGQRQDILSFAGLTDQGSPGLVDDLNAISMVTDHGRGSDVIVEFDSGSRIVFSGLGTGHIDNWNEIVAHPATQLVATCSSATLV